MSELSAEQKQSDAVAQARAEEQQVIETVLRRAFLKAVNAANLKPWPQGFELKLYKVTYCTGSTFDDEGDTDFDYAQLWSANEPFDQSGTGTVSGWDVLGTRRTLILYPHNKPTVEIITCRSYADIPSSAKGISAPIEGQISGINMRQVHDWIGFAQSDDGSSVEWNSDATDETETEWLESFNLPTREIREEILDLIPSYQDDGCGCWSCEHMEQDAQDKGYCGHAWSHALPAVMDDLTSNAVDCPGFTPNETYQRPNSAAAAELSDGTIWIV